MTNKTHYHEHAIYAFRTFTEKSQSDADINNKLAVKKTLDELDELSRNVISGVYLISGKPLKGEICNRVALTVAKFNISECTVYRILSKARKLFAIHRGLI